MSNRFKYLLLIVTGFIVVISYSLFQHISPVNGQYLYSRSFIQETFIIKPAIFFFIISLGVGYFWRLNPLRTVFFLFLIFPLTVLIEMANYEASHNLLGIEFIIYFSYALPSIIAVYIGTFIFKQIAKRKEIDNSIGH